MHKLKIRAVDGPDALMKVVKNPVVSHLPTGCRKVGFETDGKLVDVNAWAGALPQDKPVTVVIGALSHGDVPMDYVEEKISVSEYPLSAAVACSKLCCAFERKWGVL